MNFEGFFMEFYKIEIYSEAFLKSILTELTQ